MQDQALRLPGLFIETRSRQVPFGMDSQHFHSHYELYYLWSGRRQYFIGTKVYSIEPGTLVFINPGNIHRTLSVDAMPHTRSLLQIDASRYLEISAPLPRELRRELEKARAIVYCFEGAERERLEWLLNAMYLEQRPEDRTAPALLRLRLEELFLLLLRGQSQAQSPSLEGEKQQKVYEILDYISEYYADITSLDDLCARFFVSKSHLCHIFKKTTGLTVQEYLTAIRIRNAQQLLVETGTPITAIAEGVGYGSLTHFERMFKRLAGLSPGAYRRNNQMS